MSSSICLCALQRLSLGCSKCGLAARQQRSPGQPVGARTRTGVPQMPLVELEQILYAELVSESVTEAREMLVEERRGGMAGRGK